MLWEVDIYAAEGQPDIGASDVAAASAELHLAADLAVTSVRGYLIQGDFDREQVSRIADELLADRVVERTVVAPVGDPVLTELPPGRMHWIHVLPKPGVMDPVAQSAMTAIADLGLQAQAVRTMRKYAIGGFDGPHPNPLPKGEGTCGGPHPNPLPKGEGTRLVDEKLSLLCSKVLANDAIEQVIVGPLKLDHLQVGSPYKFELVTIAIRPMDDAALERLSREGQLYLSLIEMQTIQAHFRSLGRDPTDVELETIAQTWSEHCSHKTLAGRIHYRGPEGERHFQNMLKETIFAATQKIRHEAGSRDWCVSVFADNAGVIRFDDQYNVVFKVETHNHPSALEPYGGANTGIGGVIRDPMGTGMGAKPICNTDVFCFAPPDTPAESLPPGVLHPRRVMKGVVAGVRDYGNRMGIPTVNGAIYFDPRYLGNPLVYCGNIGLIPRDKSFKQTRPDDLIVAVGGRTGRDGIHGATFSSAELNSHSETISGGAVQIGNAITEKMVLDILLAARDRGLYHAVTDCGAGGFSSAVGEMGEKIGAEVWLDRIPLKYEGLSYTEMWISEAQERMVFAVPPDKWYELKALCDSESVEATVIGQFVPTDRLVLKYADQQVADLAMEFLHKGRPPVVRAAVYSPPKSCPLGEGSGASGQRPGGSGQCEDVSGSHPSSTSTGSYTGSLLGILGSLNVCSKEWVIRQYDHEVQGGSVLKPLVGAANDGPGDAAVLRPVLTSRRGIVISCGMNPRYGDFDTYWMAASAIDEAVRNCVAVGADPERIAILDNFCWGTTDRPETLGSLVRAALACYDVATVLGTPFISGKDSLNNEFRPSGKGVRPHLCEAPEGPSRQMGSDPFSAEPISIPPSLLISALGQIDDVAHCVSMDLKEPGNLLYIVGITRDELGGSHYAMVERLSGGEAPRVDAAGAKKTFSAVHRAIHAKVVRACHDLSEGGLAVAVAEMAFAGGLGARVRLHDVPLRSDGQDLDRSTAMLLFSESNTRFLCEVPAEKADAFEVLLHGTPHARIGEVLDNGRLEVIGNVSAEKLIDVEVASLKEAWRKPLRW
jgi:phosphoribosylformylglycinamidine synthase subunit PurSL